jgi:LysM repeat protein
VVATTAIFIYNGEAGNNHQVVVMVGKLGRRGIIAAIFIGTAVIVVSNNGRRTIYQPVNLMAGTPNSVSMSLTTPTSLPVISTTTEAIVVADNASVQNVANQAPIYPENAIIHTVQDGENLYRIALQYNLPPEMIATANGITDVTQIYAGQTLMIPADNLPTLEAINTSSSVIPTSTVDQNIQQIPPATYPPPPDNINGIPVDMIAAMPQGVIDHIRNIYSMGQSIGRNPHSLSKLGDSTVENPHFLTRFDSGPFNLGNYTYLQDVVSFYRGSFSRDSAVRRGLHTWAVLDPMWAGGTCAPGETMLECEFRVQNPSVLIIHLGSNDAGVPDSTNRNFREIVEYCMTNGVIPILGTKADRHEGSNINNEMIRQIAYDYNVPLWDFDIVAATIPGKGLDQDGVHMTSFFAHDWSSPTAFERGYGLMNLTALIALDKVWRAIES